MLAAFLLLGLICIFLIFLIQRASARQLKRLQEQLSSLEQKNRELLFSFSDKQFVELSANHLQLRKQFEEKSTILAQTRKELFALEGQLFTLQKEKMEQECTLGAECYKLLECLQQCQEEQHALEIEIELLEQLVSSLLSQKPKATRQKKGAEEDFFFMHIQK